MRLTIFSLCFFFFCTHLAAQDYAKVDKFVMETPDSVTRDAATLANYLTNNNVATTTEKKARAIFFWIAQNIAYDKKYDLSSPFVSLEVIAQQNADQVLAKRKGVCEGYANLFVELASAAGLRAEKVVGVVKQSDGEIPRMGHAWVAIKLRKKAEKGEKAETKWYLCDPTWAAPQSKSERGKVNEIYFLAEPASFLTEHLPFDPMWQLCEKPINIEQFASEKPESIEKLANKSGKFNFSDTINRFLRMDTLRQEETALWRMLHYNPINEYIWFGVGKVYARKAKAREERFRNLLFQALDADGIFADRERFEGYISMSKVHNRTLRDCFEKVNDPKFEPYLALMSEKNVDFMNGVYRYGYEVSLLNNWVALNDPFSTQRLERFNELSERTDSLLAVHHQKMSKIDSNVQFIATAEAMRFEETHRAANCKFYYDFFDKIDDVNNIDEKKFTDEMFRKGKLTARKVTEYQQAKKVFFEKMIGTAPAEGETMLPIVYFLDAKKVELDIQFVALTMDQRDEKKIKVEVFIADLQKLLAFRNDIEQLKKDNGSDAIKKIINDNEPFLNAIEGFNEGKIVDACIYIWNAKLRDNNDIIKSDMKEDLRFYAVTAEYAANKSTEKHQKALKILKDSDSIPKILEVLAKDKLSIKEMFKDLDN
jgi:hypothetical protein